MNEALKKKLAANPIDTDSKVVMTPVSAAQANHSYNGIIFDIESPGPYEVEIISFQIAGMLGRVRVFARDRPWETDNDDRRNPNHWWAHAESISTTGWYPVADEICSPSWDKPREIRLNAPVRLLPHSRVGFYLHSGLPDDLGIIITTFTIIIIIIISSKVFNIKVILVKTKSLVEMIKSCYGQV